MPKLGPFERFSGVKVSGRRLRELLRRAGPQVRHPGGLYLRALDDGQTLVLPYADCGDLEIVQLFPSEEQARACLDELLESDLKDEKHKELLERGATHPLTQRMKAEEVFARRDELLALLTTAGSTDLEYTVDDIVKRIAWCRRKRIDPSSDPWFSALSLYAGEIILTLRGPGSRWSVRPDGGAVGKEFSIYFVESDDGLHVAPWALVDRGLRREGYNGVKDALMTGALLRRHVSPSSA